MRSLDGRLDTLTTALSLPLGQAVHFVRQAFDDHGFTVVSCVGGVEDGFVVLGLWSPDIAAAVAAEHRLGLMFPSNVLISGDGDGSTVEACDPAALVPVAGAAGLPVALRRRLSAVIGELAAAAPRAHPGEQPPPVVETLDHGECLDLLRSGRIGRVAFDDLRGPAIAPVNYTLDGDAIVFRTSRDGWLNLSLTTPVEGADVHAAFQVDELDPGVDEGWTVLMRGPAHPVPESPADAARPWIGELRGEACYRITPTSLSGRRIRHPIPA